LAKLLSIKISVFLKNENYPLNIAVSDILHESGLKAIKIIIVDLNAFMKVFWKNLAKTPRESAKTPHESAKTPRESAKTLHESAKTINEYGKRMCEYGF